MTANRSKVYIERDARDGNDFMEDEDSPCCSASRTGTGQSAVDNVRETTGENVDTTRMVRLDGGTFTMGTDSEVGFSQDGEGPPREVALDPFYVDKYAVTNAEFYQFVDETGYTTEAERFGWSFAFYDFVDDADRGHVLRSIPETPWWVAVEGANWFRPEGPSSSVEDRLDHPVTHVTWNDAVAYCEWNGTRLPTEAEWEYAARSGLEGKRFPWGDELTPDGEHRCNVWQGEFPENDDAADGYHGTAPVNEYEPTDFGLYNVSGNVWEWCSDWFHADYHATDDYSLVDPQGPEDGNGKVMRGGSYLCHRSWCNRYRVAARSKNTPESSTANIGFRTVADC